MTIYRQCGPYARMADKVSVRQALRLLSVAAVVLFLYCLARTADSRCCRAGWTASSCRRSGARRIRQP
ncbi:hypothetical protein [Streptomyces sp. NBRC 110028]|uniref:hypothetical protein n=1 Tax=Streptomyces sp. NBRC 110028 TaxID=1621260 RepID=UPI000A457901|nr:hypothetical protein [Streptomyces sp. NBRC 110028]